MPLPELSYVGYKPREIIAKPLDRLADTVKTLDAKHQQAINQQAAIEAKLGELDLNEAEDVWRAKYADKIRNTIDEQAQFGNYASALTTATKEAGKFLNDPALRGRLKAQAEYKKFNEELDSNNRISENIKNYYREQNKYNYEDITDEKGRIVGGTAWTPTARPVDQIDMTQVMQRALQFSAKEAGGSNAVYFKKADGTMTTNPNESVDGLPYYQKEGSFQQLTRDKLSAGLKAAIANTPGAAESIKQDYDVAVWETKKSDKGTGELTISSVTDDSGRFLTEEQYLQKRVDPFLKSATFYNAESKITPLAGMSVAAKRAADKAAGDKSESLLFGKASASGGVISKPSATLSEVGAYANNLASSYDQYLQKYNIPYDANTKASDKYAMAAKAIQGDTSIPFAQKAAILENLAKTNIQQSDAQSTFEKSIKRFEDKETKSDIEFVSLIDGNSDLSAYSNNPNVQKYNKAFNKLFGNNIAEVEVNFTDDDIFNQVLNNINGNNINGATEKGYGIDKNGRTIKVSREQANNIIELVNAIGLNNITGFNKNTNIRKKLTNGQYVQSENKYDLASNEIVSFANVYNQANKRFENKTDSMFGQPINREIRIFGEQDLGAYIFKVNPEKYSDAAAAKKDFDEQTSKLLQDANYANTPMYAGVEGKSGQPVLEGSKRDAYGRFFKRQLGDSSRSKAVTASAIKNIDGQIGTKLSYHGQVDDTDIKILKDLGIDYKNGADIEIFIPGLIASNLNEAISNDPIYQAEVAIDKAEDMNTDLTLYNGRMGRNVLKIQNGLYYIEDNNGDVRNVSRDEAVNIKANYNQLYIREEMFKNIPYNSLSEKEQIYYWNITYPIIIDALGMDVNNINETDRSEITDYYKNMFKQ